MDTSLKQRLIGAIVLVALAVIFLPMLVTGPARNSTADSVPLEVPGAPANAQFETRELPLAAPAGGDSGLRGAAPLQEPAANAAATVDTGPAVAAGNFAVSFGAYASKADADAVIAHLKGAQLPGFSEAATINGKQAWRVRVGPFVDRAQAESARLQAVKIRSDVRAEVVTLDANVDGAAATAQAPAATTTPLGGNPVQTQALPETAPPAAAAAPAPKPEPKPTPTPAPDTKAVAAKPATPAPVAKPEVKPEVKAPAAPAASGVGFAVQLGAFGQAADANALRDKARAAGFSAFVDQVRTDKGVLSRVRVGPVANRAEADQLKAQVAARVGVAGMVRPHP
ncbi:SPOR domain-containing protein [Stenotrophomonas lacuserhaii]|uniref:SPOR domain-containing protein n=1 Tax=Stenotrophomonas lacuserhaii TaxID=2760084 RepID=UPI0015F80D73|nr:SPOR domain-containing protein [Stenotrophomonas lacuserhaii]